MCTDMPGRRQDDLGPPELYLSIHRPDRHDSSTEQPRPPSRRGLEDTNPPGKEDSLAKESSMGPMQVHSEECALPRQEEGALDDVVWDEIDLKDEKELLKDEPKRGFWAKFRRDTAADEPEKSVMEPSGNESPPPPHEDISSDESNNVSSSLAIDHEEVGLAAVTTPARSQDVELAQRHAGVIAVAELLREPHPAPSDHKDQWCSDRRTRLLGAIVCALLVGLIVTISLLAADKDEDDQENDERTPAPTLAGLWSQLGETIPGESALDQYGFSVALSNDGLTMAAGADNVNSVNGIRSGNVRVHKFQDGSWMQVGQSIDGTNASDSFGCSVSLNGNGTILAIGAYFHDPPEDQVECCNAGQVQVYRLEQDSWVQMGLDLYGESQKERFGVTVSLSDDGLVLAAGARWSSRVADKAGTVRVFEFANGNWTQIGDHIDGESRGDQFGDSLSLSADGNLLAIGARRNSDNGKHAGKVRVFERTVTDQWAQVGQDILGEGEGDQSSWSLAMSGDASVIAVGAPRNNGTYGVDSGHVRAYRLSANGNWTQNGSDIDGEFAGDDFGRSVALSHDGVVLAAGARYNADTAVDAGHVRVFRQVEGEWIQIGGNIGGEKRDDMSGKSIALSSSGKIVAIGADGSNDGGSNSGHVRIFQLQE